MADPPVVRETAAMIGVMDPQLDGRVWSFVGGKDPDIAFRLMGHALATFREEEGLSLIVPHDVALANEIACEAFARITLQVHSALDGVGLTAAVTTALADAGIACNVVAALHHDHLFVPTDRAGEALSVLQALAAGATTSR